MEQANNYQNRINRALNFIDKNLDQELTLEKIARVACYSPFHFHRIFKTVVKETLNTYIHRKRVEKAAATLIRKQEVSITQLYLENGFNSNSSFTRAFKKFYGISPSEFKNTNPGRYSKIGKVESKNGQKKKVFEEYICDINNHKNWIKMNAKIEVKELPQLELAYITHIGDAGLGDAFYKLLEWAGPKGILRNPDFKMATIYHDSFRITAADKVRMSVCITLDEPVDVDQGVGLTTIEKGKYIVGHFEIQPQDFGQSWRSLFIWMNENGYKKSDQNPFEIYHNDFNKHPEKKAIVDMCIPIQ